MPHQNADGGVARPTFIDLFAGAGGLSLGFREAGFRPVFAVEHDKASAESYGANFPEATVFNGDIESIESFPDMEGLWDVTVDLVIGGPPCQGFSPLGKMTVSKGRKGRHEIMNALCMRLLQAVQQLRPKAFVMENVPQFLKSEEFRVFFDLASQEGYFLFPGVLNAAEYGVPQKRRRAFTVGVLDGMSSLPGAPGIFRSVADAIGDLPKEPTESDLHFGRNPTPKSLERYRLIPPGGSRFDLMEKRPDLCPKCWLNKPTGSTDVFGRLKWDEPSLTIRTEFFKPEKGRYLHPEAHRPITHREAARLQSFPDEFRFLGSRIEIARQIGNAVPPLLAYRVALHVLSLIGREDAVREWDPFLREEVQSKVR